MNFLAHLYLTDFDPPGGPAMVGGLLPDLVRGKVPAGLDPRVMAGVENHRRVDRLTDAHPVFNRSRSRLRPNHGIFAGILTDVFYDHCLSLAWGQYHPEPLGVFIDRAHRQLADHEALMPQAMRPIIRRMIAQGWLADYASFDGLTRVLGMMSHRFAQRTRRAIDLTPAVGDLQTHHEAICADFAEFFPDLIAAVGVDHRPAASQRSVA